MYHQTRLNILIFYYLNCLLRFVFVVRFYFTTERIYKSVNKMFYLCCAKVYLSLVLYTATQQKYYDYSSDPTFLGGFFVLDSVVIISMSKSVNELAVKAAGSEALREDFIRQQEPLILKTASRASWRYITKSDDEWSIALGAFSDAIDKYQASQGAFIPFSQMLMKRALIDFHRKSSLHPVEISTSPFVLEGLDDAKEASDAEKVIYIAVVKQSQASADRSLQEEIISANELLQQYGFRFFDLTECSPRQAKTKQECAKAIRIMLSDDNLMKSLEKSRKLPVRKLAADSGVSRKTLDRYRKYLIMAVLILHGEYPQIAEYLKFVWKGESV